jgi:hypothetical protein
MLSSPVKVPDFNNPSAVSIVDKDDERAVALARRAQQGDYDDGELSIQSEILF